jgi:hypothetical protein
MMEKKHLILAAGLLGLVFVQACKKKTTDSDNTIPVDQQVKGLIYGSVNDKAWNSDPMTKKYVVHYQDSFFSFNENIYGTEGGIFGDTITLSGARVLGTDSSQLHMDIVLTNSKVGTYTLSSYPVRNAGKAFAYYYNKLGTKASKVCRTGYTYSGSINITSFKDSTGQISGTYNITMTPKNAGNSKTPEYKIKNGRFTDVYYGL